MIAHDRDMLFYEHGGTLPGFSSILRIAPERRLRASRSWQTSTTPRFVAWLRP